MEHEPRERQDSDHVIAARGGPPRNFTSRVPVPTAKWKITTQSRASKKLLSTVSTYKVGEEPRRQLQPPDNCQPDILSPLSDDFATVILPTAFYSSSYGSPSPPSPEDSNFPFDCVDCPQTLSLTYCHDDEGDGGEIVESRSRRNTWTRGDDLVDTLEDQTLPPLSSPYDHVISPPNSPPTAPKLRSSPARSETFRKSNHGDDGGNFANGLSSNKLQTTSTDPDEISEYRDRDRQTIELGEYPNLDRQNIEFGQNDASGISPSNNDRTIPNGNDEVQEVGTTVVAEEFAGDADGYSGIEVQLAKEVFEPQSPNPVQISKIVRVGEFEGDLDYALHESVLSSGPPEVTKIGDFTFDLDATFALPDRADQGCSVGILTAGTTTRPFVPRKSKHAAMMERMAASIAMDRTKPKKEVRSKLTQIMGPPPINIQIPPLPPRVKKEKMVVKSVYLKKVTSLDGDDRRPNKMVTPVGPNDNRDVANSADGTETTSVPSRRESIASSLASSITTSSSNGHKNGTAHLPHPTAIGSRPIAFNKSSCPDKTLESKGTRINNVTTHHGVECPNEHAGSKVTRATNPMTLRDVKGHAPKSPGKVNWSGSNKRNGSTSSAVFKGRSRILSKVCSDGSCPTLKIARHKMNAAIIAVQALAVMLNHELQVKDESLTLLKNEIRSVQTRSKVDLQEAQARTDTFLANQKECYEMRLECLERLKVCELAEVRNRFDVERDKLVQIHQQTIDGLRVEHQGRLRDVEEVNKADKLRSESDQKILAEECETIRQKFVRAEANFMKNAEKKLDVARSTYQTQRSEIESLSAVLEMKNGELHRLRVENLSLDKKGEELIVAREEVERLRMKMEELQAIIDNKSHCEQQLCQEKVQLRHAYEKESKVNQRLSFEVEELAWKLKQNKTVIPKRNSIASATSTTGDSQASPMSRSVECSPFSKRFSPNCRGDKLLSTTMLEDPTSVSCYIPKGENDDDNINNGYFVRMYVGNNNTHHNHSRSVSENSEQSPNETELTGIEL